MKTEFISLAVYTDFMKWNSLIIILDSQSDSSSATHEIVRDARQQVHANILLFKHVNFLVYYLMMINWN